MKKDLNDKQQVLYDQMVSELNEIGSLYEVDDILIRMLDRLVDALLEKGE